MDLNTCPKDRDETAEAFVMGRLPAVEKTAFAAHLLTCADCRLAVKSAEDFIAAIRGALGRQEDDDDPSRS